jgi:hypothetical protein
MNIKECPFCGSTEIKVCEIFIRAWSAKCDNCDTLGPEEDSAEFATLAWNKGTPRHHRVHKLEAALERIAKGSGCREIANQIAREALE